MSETTTQLGSFKLIPIIFTGGEKPYTRWLFIRERVDDASVEGRALFVGNLPPNCSEEFVSGIFGQCGRILSISFESKRIAGDSATVVFSGEEGVRAALCTLSNQEMIDEGKETQNANGLSHWIAEAKKKLNKAKDPSSIQKEADESVAAFVERKHRLVEQKEQLASNVDEDGFTLVVHRRGGRTKKASGTKELGVKVAKPLGVGQLARDRREAEAERQKILADFYRFSQRDAQNAQVTTLQRRFQLDKQRVERMKANRKFM